MATILDVKSAYSCALGWLAERGRLVDNAQPVMRWPNEIILEMVSDMELTHAPATIRARLWGLKKCLALIQPEVDLARFDDAIRNVSVPRRRAGSIIRILALPDLTRLGFDLMEEATAASSMNEISASFLHQTGLQIALLSRRPWRAGVFTSMQIGVHLQQVGTKWRLIAPRSQSQAKSSANAPFPDELVAGLERHLRSGRDILRQGQDVGSSLWLRPYGERFNRDHLRYWVTKRTAQRFGEPVTPHDFRRIAATTIARDHPKLVHVTQTVLGHSQPRTAEVYYEMADSIVAFGSLEETIRDLMRRPNRWDR